MIQNVGTLDRMVRIVIGLGLLSMLYLVESNARWWGLIGLIPLATGILGFCPGYKFMHVDTLEQQNKA